MKRSIISLLAFLAALSCSAQKLTKSSLGSFSFTGYPTLPIPLGYKLYALVDDAGLSHPYGKTVSNSIVLANRTKVKSAESAELIIRITEIQEHISPVSTDQRELFKGDVPTFKARQMKEISFNITIEDTSGVVYSNPVRDEKAVESGWMSDAAKAEKDVQQQLQGFTLINELRKYNTLINAKLGAQNLTMIYLHLYGAKDKKEAISDYDSLTWAAQTYKEAVEVIKADEFDAERFTEKAKYCVSVWERELDNYRIGDKRISDELAAALHYNLATYYIFIRDYEEALNELDLSEKTHKGFSNAKELYTIVRTWRNMKRNYDKMIQHHSTSFGK